MELDAVWAHLHQRNARRLARGRGPLQIDDLAAYIVGTAARMARERLGPADRDALAAYRAARGPARPSGGRGP
jgi:mono/diheme cytochrome c family protein